VFYHKMNFSDESLECLAMIKFAKVCHVSLDIREGSSYCVLPSILKRNVISHLYLCLSLLNFPQLPEVSSAIEKPTISELSLQVGLGPQGLELASAIGEMKHLLILKLSHYVTDFDLYFSKYLDQLHLEYYSERNLRRITPPHCWRLRMSRIFDLMATIEAQKSTITFPLAVWRTC
jgi:hypothetical protein